MHRLTDGQHTPGKGAARSGSQGSSASLAPGCVAPGTAQLACIPTPLLGPSCVTLDKLHTVSGTHFAHLQNEGNGVRRRW